MAINSEKLHTISFKDLRSWTLVRLDSKENVILFDIQESAYLLATVRPEFAPPVQGAPNDSAAKGDRILATNGNRQTSSSFGHSTSSEPTTFPLAVRTNSRSVAVTLA